MTFTYMLAEETNISVVFPGTRTIIYSGEPFTSNEK
jgi:hypothetical protein